MEKLNEDENGSRSKYFLVSFTDYLGVARSKLVPTNSRTQLYFPLPACYLGQFLAPSPWQENPSRSIDESPFAAFVDLTRPAVGPRNGGREPIGERSTDENGERFNDGGERAIADLSEQQTCSLLSDYFGEYPTAIPQNPRIFWRPATSVCRDVQLTKPHPLFPREILKKQILEFDRVLPGVQLKVGGEFEFWVFPDSGTSESCDVGNRKIRDRRDRAISNVYPLSGCNRPGYSLEGLLEFQAFATELMDASEDAGFHPYQIAHEAGAVAAGEGPSSGRLLRGHGAKQFELNTLFDECLTAADKQIYFKFLVKSIAKKHGLQATFMPKPFADRCGNSGHIHISLWRKNVNLFVANSRSHDESSNGKIPQKMTPENLTPELWKEVVSSSIITNIAALAAFANPTINSYSRLFARPGNTGENYTPVNLAVTDDDRKGFIRIPAGGNDRLEWRSPDAAADPYLLYGALIACLRDALSKIHTISPASSSTPAAQSEPSAQPRSLREAVAALETHAVLPRELGEDFVRRYVEQKQVELNDHDYNQVSDWELARYLNI